MGISTFKLSRELRFGLYEGHDLSPSRPSPETVAENSKQANGFAGNPYLSGIAPFLCLIATFSGTLDSRTGMLINIKHIDILLRTFAVPLIRDYYYHPPENLKGIARGAGDLMLQIFHHKHDGNSISAAFAPHRLESLMLRLSPYLSLTVHAKEPTVVQLSLRFEFSAAHRLHSPALSDGDNRAVFGRCNNLNGHGHNYELEVTIGGTPHPVTGQILPIPHLQQIVNERLIDVFDHKHFNLDCPDFAAGNGINPTVENIARVLYTRLKPAIPGPARLASIKLWETPKTMCEYSE